ncbi:anaerobic ribonucleoside-triphosphate reductase activating protein [Anoxybacterium hadale]|uniref:Anaerobic ribonucleoside-triphosphate reductase activating protein n=1 Tax=Anoxybacterium hadale TaxID=3408580 RepID=A0ACD1AFJ6_9FIRM|nr:anaerobic ribonucleoside-triphosphate reductase activating protein [Clostridiales bacterium]
MNISGIVKSSLIDYPGLISCVIFVPGCNYTCFYCHNRQLVDGSHVLLSPRYVMDFLEKRAGLLDGAVISGGEPTLQAGLLPFLTSLKQLGYQVKLDTNGSNPHIIEALIHSNLCNYFAVDYKAPATRYPSICGMDSDASKVLKTLEILLDNEVPFEVRTTVFPELGAEDLMVMAQELPVVPRYVLNRYRPPEKFLPEDELRIRRKAPTPEELQFFAACVSAYQPNVFI